MKLIKCDKCCIGYEGDICAEGSYPVYEGFSGYLDEEFSFCPHCGFELPEYVYKPAPQRRKPTDKVLSKWDKVIFAAYAPAIRESLESSLILSDLLDKHGVDSPEVEEYGAEDNIVKVSIHDPLREQREHGIGKDDYEPTKQFQ